MEIKPLKFNGVFEIIHKPINDNRGYFMEVYYDTILKKHGLSTKWVQENQSLSVKKHTIRGLHFQKKPYTQAKLIRVIIGSIFDVFVDIRKDSKTYGQWSSVILSDKSYHSLYMAKGFAHGFCTLTENVVVTYKVDKHYNPQYESGIIWNDKTLNIKWPTTIPHLSQKDGSLPFFNTIIPI